jgi:hypothetical protein
MAVNFATFADLTKRTNDLTLNEQRMIKAAAATRTAAKPKDTFLSHSSKDAAYLPGVIKLLEEHSASVYCDLDDKRMPEKPTPDTAAIIKQEIRKCVRLVIFITTNSKDSTWVPWELGIGDASLSPDNVALLPTAQLAGDQAWAKQEYLGLYRHIVWGRMEGESKDIWMVYDYRTNKAEKLSQWCRK